MSDLPQAERSRVESYNKRKEIEVMCDYLLKKASENHLSDKRQRESEMPQIKDIILWTQITE